MLSPAYRGFMLLPVEGIFVLMLNLNSKLRVATQRAKFAEKVHKPPLCINVINFELNWFDASIWVP